MSKTDIKCSICGALNKSLDLEKSDGWMKCENCGEILRYMEYVTAEYVPGYQKNDVRVLVPLSKK